MVLHVVFHQGRGRDAHHRDDHLLHAYVRAHVHDQIALCHETLRNTCGKNKTL